MLFCSNSAQKSYFSEIQLVGDGPTDRRMDGRTDTPSYRDARTHLKKRENEQETDRQTDKQKKRENEQYRDGASRMTSLVHVFLFLMIQIENHASRLARIYLTSDYVLHVRIHVA